MISGMKHARDSVSSLQQMADRSWPRASLYYSGPKKRYAWGSEELTTGFCLEALLRYRITCSASETNS